MHPLRAIGAFVLVWSTAVLLQEESMKHRKVKNITKNMNEYSKTTLIPTINTFLLTL